jgi:quinol monooxygenase YgiN
MLSAMSDRYGMHVRFTTTPGQGDALEALLLEAGEGARVDDACLLYVISRSPTEPDTVWVTEAWTGREAHDASLQDDATRALIERAMPLLADRPDAQELRPVGGKGL